MGVLIAGLCLLGAVFHAEIGDALTVWASSTAYNHCFLILPMAAWLAWQRRPALAGLAPRPVRRALPALLALGFALGLAWFAADRLGLMEGRQLTAIGFVQLLVLAVLGGRIWRALAAPLLYLFFLVPFGGFLVPLLQNFSTHFVVHGLDLLGIPNFNDGNSIEIPEGTFYIAAACAGLRFLIAAIAFSVFYATVIYRSAGRRILFITVSLFVPVIANGLRCLGIVWLGHVLGSARAAATDHVLYGYLFFSIVLGLLILLGLAFREDLAPPGTERRPPAPAGRQPLRAPTLIPMGISMGALLLLAALFPLIAARLDRVAAAARVAIPGGPSLLAGCTPAPRGPVPGLAAAGAPVGAAVGRFACAGGTLTLTLAALPPRSDPKLVLDAERSLSGQDIPEAETQRLTVPGAMPEHWQMVVIGTPPSVSASALWIDGRPAPGGLRTRWHQALNSLFGGRYPPLIVTLRAAGGPDEAAGRITAFLAAGRIDPAVRHSLAMAALSR